MTSRIALRRLALRPLRLEEKRAPTAARLEGDALSPTVVVAKVVFGALLVLMGLTFVAAAPMTIAVFVALASLSGLLALLRLPADSAPRGGDGSRGDRNQ